MTKAERRSDMAGRSEGDKGKKEEPYGEEEGDSTMKNSHARKLMEKAMKIVKEASKSKKNYRKCMGELEKITSLDGFQDEDDANMDGKVSSLAI
jgi:hypothetical protein